MKFSYFNPGIHKTTPAKSVTLEKVYEMITTDEDLKQITKDVRAGVKTKDDLPYITVSGLFKKRNLNELISYTGIIGIDLDHVKDLSIRDKLNADIEVPLALSFVSPSGTGLKLFYVVRNARQEDHLAYFKALENYLLKKWSLPVDATGKDIPRACWLSSACSDPGYAYFSNASIDSADLLKYAPVDPVPNENQDGAAAFFERPASPDPVRKKGNENYYFDSDNQYENDGVQLLLKNPLVHLHAVKALQNAGWKEKKKNRWARPGTQKDSSAVFSYYPPAGCFIFKNFSDNGFPFGDKGLTDIGVIAVLEFNGDTYRCIQSLNAGYNIN